MLLIFFSQYIYERLHGKIILKILYTLLYMIKGNTYNRSGMSVQFYKVSPEWSAK